MKSEKLQTINHFSILKGIAVLLVVGWHVGNTKVVFYLGEANFSWLFDWNETLGVWIFFIISGYLIGKGFYSEKYSFSQSGITTFYINRLFKIIPLYYSVLIYYFLFYGNAINFPVKNLFSYFLFTANTHIRDPYIGYLWFISIIMMLYFISPLIYFLLKTLQNHRISITTQSSFLLFYFAIVIFIGILNNPLTNWSIYNSNLYPTFLFNSIFFIFGFFINTLLLEKDFFYKILQKKLFFYFYLNKIIIASLIVIFLFAAYINYFSEQNFFQYNFLVLIILPLFAFFTFGLYIYFFELRKKTVNTQFDFLLAPKYFFGILGNFSFGIYLFQYPVIDLFGISCNNHCSPFNFFLRLLFVLSAAIIMSIIYKLIMTCFTSPSKVGKY